MTQKKSLKKEILQLLILFSIVTISIIGFLSIYSQYSSKIEIIKHNQNLVLKQVEKEVQKLILEIESIENYLTRNDPFEKSLLKNIVETNNNISSILILDKEGIIEEFYAMSNLNLFKGFDYSNKAYFKNLKNNSSYWSSVFLSTLDETPSISYSFRMNGKICVFMINLSELSDFMLRFKNSDNTHMIRMIDNSGVLIINPDAKQLVVQRFNASRADVFKKLINSGKPYTQVVFKSIKEYGNQFGAFTKIDKTGWYIIVRESHDLILKSLNNIIFSFVFSIVLLIICSIYFSFKISKKIFKSFDDMQMITSKIADGNYNIELKDLHYDEFNKLLNSFNRMQIEIDKREDYLENSLSSFKSLFNSTMESVILSENGIIVDVNDVSLDLLEAKKKEELVGKKLIDFVATEYISLVKDSLSKDIQPYEVEFIKLDGTKIHALVQGKNLKLRGKNIRLSAIIDITELKNKNQLLSQQSKMASMGEMIGNIAHQWRQPLSIISTCASGIKLEKEFGNLNDEKLEKSMDLIVQNSQYLSCTIDDFRNFFKSDKNQERFVVNNIVEKSLQLLKSTLKNNEIEIITNFSDKKFEHEGYPNELIQVLINIINNSRDAFNSKDIYPRFIEIKEVHNLNSYELQIKDNAGGIPDTIINRIFDPYFTTKHKSQGTGIGLYMSHQIIVDHMNGELKCKNIKFKHENDIYDGCCFYITLYDNTEHNYTYII